MISINVLYPSWAHPYSMWTPMANPHKSPVEVYGTALERPWSRSWGAESLGMMEFKQQKMMVDIFFLVAYIF